MKIQELRNLIKEEVRKVINEGTQTPLPLPAYVKQVLGRINTDYEEYTKKQFDIITPVIPKTLKVASANDVLTVESRQGKLYKLVEHYYNQPKRKKTFKLFFNKSVSDDVQPYFYYSKKENVFFWDEYYDSSVYFLTKETLNKIKEFYKSGEGHYEKLPPRNIRGQLVRESSVAKTMKDLLKKAFTVAQTQNKVKQLVDMLDNDWSVSFDLSPNATLKDIESEINFSDFSIFDSSDYSSVKKAIEKLLKAPIN